MDITELQRRILFQVKQIFKAEPESISGVEKISDGWAVQCDFLEKKAVPETFDLLKIFEFKTDKEGKILGFKQLKKVRRGDLG